MTDIFIKRASALVITYSSGSRFQVTNYVFRKSLSCNHEGIEFLNKLSSWTSINNFLEIYKEYNPLTVINQIDRFINAGIVLIQKSPEQIIDEKYSNFWEWGVIAGLFHFGIRDAKYLDDAETEVFIKKRAKKRPAPQNYLLNGIGKSIIQLPPVNTNDCVFKSMFSRRTIRGFHSKNITQNQIGEILFSGLGIIGFYEDPLLGTMPVKLTPSGGARNPYEAYVYSLNIKGLKKGVYHYSALEHSFKLINSKNLPTPGEILSGQEWTNDASAIILLVANYDRTIWKYQNPTAYRVVIIEAGHIAQNIQITAAKLGLSANPTSAIQDSIAEKLLKINPPECSVVYALSIGHPDISKGPIKK